MYNSEDTSSVQAYDCVYHQAYPYCRRPSQPTSLQRDGESNQCHSGMNHSFRSLRSKNVTIHTVLQKWKSSLDKADQYAHYLQQPADAKEGEKQLCECIDPKSFGKNCEYLLPLGNAFTDVVATKFWINFGKLTYVGEIVCYSTLKCDFGLLCLDWRDICDGVQQCMFGLDEENCDKLEFNECEENEYRCMNGMCIPDEYFLDGEYDCMDMSDEKESFYDIRCPFESASVECDDRVCPSNLWSCGDGQCIKERSVLASWYAHYTSCFNRRDQFFWCERVIDEDIWTASHGRCVHTVSNAMIPMYSDCAYLLLCATSGSRAYRCPCKEHMDRCADVYRNQCTAFGLIPYPAGALIAPYAFQYFDVQNDSSSVSTVSHFNGTIKCRGYLATYTDAVPQYFFPNSLLIMEAVGCEKTSDRLKASYGGHHPDCHNDSRTFNNHSYHWIDVCTTSSQCISAYRIKDGFTNCDNQIDEQPGKELVSKSCSSVRRHRFRCSIEVPTCLSANALADLGTQCGNTKHLLSRSIQIAVSRAQCNRQSTVGCSLLRGLIEASWHHSLYNYTGLQTVQLKKLPFRCYCNTFQDTLSNDDEDSILCQSLWTCSSKEWQCYTGQCIALKWVLDMEWDCPDGSDEETMFAVGFNASHSNSKWLTDASFIARFRERFQNLSLQITCDEAIVHGCSGASSAVNSTGCVAEYDKDYVFAYCLRTLITFNDSFECSSMNLSTTTAFTFRKLCSTKSDDDDGRFESHANTNRQTSRPNVTCWNGGVKQRSRCNAKRECQYREDEFLCGQEGFEQTFYRTEKQEQLWQNIKHLKLPVFPVDASQAANLDETTADQDMTPTVISAELSSLSDLPSLLNWCNRGVPVWTRNGSFVCFCPPQYHGDQCQFHSDRITLLLHVNYTHSGYTASTNKTIVHKFLVLLVYYNEVISADEFHVRPAQDIPNYRKKFVFMHYSRCAYHIQRKQQRYFNRSNIINDQPFSIRIEAYELQSTRRPRRFAVWRYPIFFDYLPVYRFATVLRFLPPSEVDPCRTNPCGRNEVCHRVQNGKSQYICCARAASLARTALESIPTATEVTATRMLSVSPHIEV